jgi:hypothetical protein
MAKNTKSFLRLTFLTLPFIKKKTALQLETLDMLIDEIVRKNNVVVTHVQEKIEQLDVENFPTSTSTSTSTCTSSSSSTSAPKYRWERLIKDLDSLSERLQHLKRSLHKMQVRKVVYLFMLDLWPLALKISCRYQIETGVQGDWIEDTSALYLLCEQYADAVREEGNVRPDEFVVTQYRGENTMCGVDVNSSSDEDQIYDSNDGKRAS